MLSRCPVDAFDAPGVEARWPTFGIKLGVAPGPATEVHNKASMLRAMLNAMTGFYDRRHADDAAAAAGTIVVETGCHRRGQRHRTAPISPILADVRRAAALEGGSH
jgi:hypothetical protein